MKLKPIKIKYNHCETFTVPSEIFTEDGFSFAIKITAFKYSDEGDTKYTIIESSHLDLRYELDENNTVTIDFE